MFQNKKKIFHIVVILAALLMGLYFYFSTKGDKKEISNINNVKTITPPTQRLMEDGVITE